MISGGGIFLWLFLTALGALVAGFLVARTLPKKESRESTASRVRMETEMATLIQTQQALTGRMQAMSESQTQAQAALNETLNQRLDAVSQRMGQGLTDATEKTTGKLGELQARLAVIDAAQKNLTELSSRVVSLQEVLDNKQARGAFGERRLEDLVSEMLSEKQYSFQATLSNGKRVDCLIQLPNPPGPVPIDSKFPLEAWRALSVAGDETQAKKAASNFRTAVQTHIRDIAEKYLVPGETSSTAMMFIPSEAVYAELHANFSNVIDEAYRARVVIVSPSTLWATLNTIRAVLKDVKMREQAFKIQDEVAKLLKDVGLLDERVKKLRKNFGLAHKNIEDIEISTGKIIRKGTRIEAVEVEAPEQPERMVTGKPRTEHHKTSLPDTRTPENIPD